MRRGFLAGTSVVFAVMLGAVPGSALATTVVTGDTETNAPLVIDPTTNSTDAETLEVSSNAMGRLAFIERMPVSKVVSQVTIGDVARAASCSDPVPVELYVHEHSDGNLVAGDQVAYSDPEDLPASPGKVTFDIPPTLFRKGRGYSFTLGWGAQPCRRGVMTTWAHNEGTVDGGEVRCTRGAPADPDGQLIEHRMWHSAGLGDKDPACASFPQGWAFSPDMPEGWLMTDQNGWYVVDATGYPTAPDPVSACGERAANAGAKTVYWRPDPYGGNDWVCMWTQFRPLNEQSSDGWYFGMPWKADGTGAPRDVYLRLDPIDYDGLLQAHAPEFFYDNDELYSPLAASSITDFFVQGGDQSESNSAQDPSVTFAISNPDLAVPLDPASSRAQLALSYLGPTYPEDTSWITERGGTAAQDYDFLSESSGSGHGSYQDDSRQLADDPSGRYFGRMYGHVASDSEGRPWLQYWVFYYYNGSFSLFDHEGDWESVQVRLDHNLQPELVSYEAHDGEETCSWADAESYNGHPLVYVAAGTHANYSHAGVYRGGTDQAEGDGLWLLAPSIESISTDTPWVGWPGHWGDSGTYGADSPRGPAFNDPLREWHDPDAWIGNVDDCAM